MLIRRMAPLATFNELRREMDRLFDGAGRGERFGLPRLSAFPPINAWEDGQNYYVEAELPGIELKDIELQVVGQELTLKGSRAEPQWKDEVIHRRERGTGEFSRRVTLPTAVDAEKVEAVLKNGVLTVRLPKSPEAMARKIAIRNN